MELSHGTQDCENCWHRYMTDEDRGYFDRARPRGVRVLDPIGQAAASAAFLLEGYEAAALLVAQQFRDSGSTSP